MVRAGDFTEDNPPATYIRKTIHPIEKIYGFNAPEIRGAVPIKENVLCPNCHTINAVLERSWIGGWGYVVSLVCEAEGCGYWERSVK